MKNQLLAKKYTRGLVGALKDEAEFRRVQGEIEGFAGLMRSREDLRERPVQSLAERPQKGRDRPGHPRPDGLSG